MITVTCAWDSNDPETRERAQEHRTETIRLQIADAEGSTVCVLKDDRCEYEIDCSESWGTRHMRHLIQCDRMVAEIGKE